MGMCALGDILKAKVDELLGNIEGIKTYIDNIFVLGKDCFRKQIEQIRMIFGILRSEGLKVNSPKCSFGFRDITYLGYDIKR